VHAPAMAQRKITDESFFSIRCPQLDLNGLCKRSVTEFSRCHAATFSISHSGGGMNDGNDAGNAA
jgi:hypothetical protein